MNACAYSNALCYDVSTGVRTGCPGSFPQLYPHEKSGVALRPAGHDASRGESSSKGTRVLTRDGIDSKPGERRLPRFDFEGGVE